MVQILSHTPIWVFALFFVHFSGTGAECWLNLQKLCELRLAEAQAGAKIRRLPTLDARGKSDGRQGRRACELK